MTTVTIYHNPRCSKSRETLALLKENGIEPTVVEYLKTPLNLMELKTLVSQLKLPAKNIIRKKESLYKTLALDHKNDEALLKAIAKHPVLMERPIVVHGNKAAIGRPPENVLEIL